MARERRQSEVSFCLKAHGHDLHGRQVIDIELNNTQAETHNGTEPKSELKPKRKYAGLIRSLAFDAIVREQVAEIFREEIVPQTSCNRYDLFDDAYSTHENLPIHSVFREDDYTTESRP